MKLTKPTYLDVLHIAENMSEASRNEVFALRSNDDPAELATEFMDTCGHVAFIAWWDNPTTVIGATQIRPAAWETFMFSTDELHHILPRLTRFAKKQVIPFIKNSGARSISTYTLSTHLQALRWARLLGIERVVDLPQFGRNGEQFTLSRWIRADVLPV